MQEQWEVAFTNFSMEDPEQLLFSPYRCYIHPHTQQQAADASLQKFGWLLPVVVNLETQHVLHGAMLVERAAYYGQKLVPTLHVRIPEEDEPAAVLALNAIGRMSLPDDDVPYIRKPDGELLYLLNISPFDEVVLKASKSKRMNPFITLLMRVGAIRIGKESRSRTAKRAALKLEQMTDIKYQIKNHGKALYSVPGTSVRIYGDRKEVEAYLKENDLGADKAA